MRAIILFLILCGCQTIRYHENVEIIRTVKHEEHSYREVFNACMAEQIDLCGDMICEGDLGFEIVMQGIHSAVNWCFDDPSTITWKYFEQPTQSEIINRKYDPYDDDYKYLDDKGLLK